MTDIIKPLPYSDEDQEPTTNSSKKRGILFTLLLINFTEVLGFSIFVPILPFIALDLGLNELHIGMIGSIFSLCQLFASPITGKLSDSYGRKPLLIISQFSTFLGFFILGLAQTVAILIVARVIDGLLGSNMTVVQASFSDITKPEERTKIYSLSSGVFGAGLIIGPAIGGILAEIAYAIPMFLAAGISLISILLVIFLLPETNETKTKLQLRVNDIVPIKDTKRYFKEENTRFKLMLFFIYQFAFMLFITNFTLILIEKYDISVQFAGYYRTWIGILRVILQFMLSKWILDLFHEDKILLSGILTMVEFGYFWVRE